VEPEITAKVAKMRCRIYEVGISYDGRNYSEGKKIGWKDALAALSCVVRYGLFGRVEKTIGEIYSSAEAQPARKTEAQRSTAGTPG
jgi:hypothetical protein